MLDYITIPKSVFIEVRTSKALHVLCALAFNRNVNTNRSHFMTKPVIANLAGISRRYVKAVLVLLEDKELITEVAERRGEYMYHLPCMENAETETVDLESLMKKVQEI